MNIATRYRIMIADLSRGVPLVVRETENDHFVTIRTKYSVSVATLSREIALVPKSVKSQRSLSGKDSEF
ncbi:hypothetical protein [Caballeronia mineralivorans]|jgi:hypothetical protein|uniref:hypothetical protein n=1 Tax=Caballeronia mineralivorans TaxID=2010198 RepID=UPI0023F0B0C9|nr:hypothetical protein [Caballeronia mineralivorans]MDB5788231.1 hypothetical protein [Caballeronia mineralivorans]